MPPPVLDFDAKHDVRYCVPTWVRDENVKLALARVKGRIGDPRPVTSTPAAVVCFGPSLADTWQDIKNFRVIFTCSGSHKFLTDRGLTPDQFDAWYHVEVDPRPHKVELIGAPQKGVQYLIASACHPKVFDHLEGCDVKLWHVFTNEVEPFRDLPPGEWAVTGGCSVGLRCLTLARFFGHTNLHVFGMDGSEGATGKHAAEHPMQPKGHSLTEYKGVQYRTTPAMLEAAKGTFHELNQLKDVTVQFHGEGLVQEMAADYVRKPANGPVDIGIAKPELISAEYRELNARLHRENVAYGVGGGKHADVVQKLAASLATTSILDYGCGRGYLQKALPYPIWEYDPAIPGKDQTPRPADVVVCTDVLEHVEPDRLAFVLADLARVTRQIGYFVIHTGPSSKFLADGRNSHLIQRGRGWWESKLRKFFLVGKVIESNPLLYVVVAPKPQKVKHGPGSALRKQKDCLPEEAASPGG